MSKFAFVSAPMLSMIDQRDEVAAQFAKFGINVIVLTEDWKLSVIEVGAVHSEVKEIAEAPPQGAMNFTITIKICGGMSEEDVRKAVHDVIDDVAERVGALS